MKYGIFGSLTTTEGKRKDFVGILGEGIKNMPGCIRYDISLDGSDQDKIWIYELWETKEHHEKSLMLPSVQKAIEAGGKMIQEFGSKTDFIPFIH